MSEAAWSTGAAGAAALVTICTVTGALVAVLPTLSNCCTVYWYVPSGIAPPWSPITAVPPAALVRVLTSTRAVSGVPLAATGVRNRVRVAPDTTLPTSNCGKMPFAPLTLVMSSPGVPESEPGSSTRVGTVPAVTIWMVTEGLSG